MDRFDQEIQVVSHDRKGSGLGAALLASLLACGLLVVPFAYWLNKQELVDADIARLLNEHASEVAQQTQERLRTFETLARGARGFVEGSDAISAREFRAYVTSVRLEQAAPGLLGLGLVTRVEAAQLDQHLAQIGAQHGEPYAVYPPGKRESYAPITYFEPANESNRKAIGFDLFTNPKAQPALKKAETSEELALSERLRLVQDGPQADGLSMAYAIYLSAYREGARDAARGTVGKELVGWISAPFRLRDVVGPGLNRLPAGLTVSIVETGSGAGTTETIAQVDGRVQSLPPPPTELTELGAEATFALGGRQWLLRLTPDTAFLAAHRDRSHDRLAAVGAVLCLTLAFIAWLLLTSRQRALSVAGRMTSRLRAISDEMSGTLNALPDRLIELSEDGTCLSFRFNARQFPQNAAPQLIGKQAHQVLPPAAADGVMASLQEAKETGLSQGRVVSIPGRKSPRWFELSVARTETKIDGERRYILIARDITDRVHASLVLEANQQVLAEAQHVAAVGHFWVDSAVEQWIGAGNALSLLGLAGEGARPLVEVVALVDARERDDFYTFCQAGERAGRHEFEFRLARAGDGVVRWLVVRTRPDIQVPCLHPGVKSDAQRFFTIQDITERRKSEGQLRLLEKAIASLNDIVIITDAEPINAPGPRIVFVNDAFERRMGYTRQEVLGRSPRLLQGPDTDRKELDRVRAALEQWKPVRATLLNYTKAGKPVWIELDIQPIADEKGWFTHWVSVERDITRRKAIEAKVHQLAYFDVLTGLPNRAYFQEIAKLAQQQAQERGEIGAMFLIDLDNFKVVNDTWGHRSGDELLKTIATRLHAVIPSSGQMARLGGDEFTVVLGDLEPEPERAQQRVMVLCEALLTAMAAPVQIEGRPHISTVSIGVALFGGPLGPVEDLLRRADSAMYAAKGAGRNTYRFFDERLQQEIEQKALLETDLRLAIDKGELYLAYQPKVAADGRVLGVEALCRWRHPERGEIPPSLFIPLAENCGLIYRIGMWILQRGLADLRDWGRRDEMREVGLAVNVSARQFHHPDFVTEVKQAIRQSGADARRLTLELTESVVAQDVEGIIQTMHAIRDDGVRFSLDDFGTGYSSLSYLRQLPLHEVKIDRSFVVNVASDSVDESVVRTVVALAQSLGFSVVAEGVETQDQHRVLVDCGCHQFQGYHFYRPMTADALVAALSSRGKP